MWSAVGVFAGNLGCVLWLQDQKSVSSRQPDAYYRSSALRANHWRSPTGVPSTTACRRSRCCDAFRQESQRGLIMQPHLSKVLWTAAVIGMRLLDTITVDSFE